MNSNPEQGNVLKKRNPNTLTVGELLDTNFRAHLAAEGRVPEAKANAWTAVGAPVKAHGIQYTVTYNCDTKEYAVNPINTGNAGRLSQVRVTAQTYADTGLPDFVKKLIRQHCRAART